MKTLFGPVPSRRLGRSLGIDVIPRKTCSYDCIYCESGRTTHLTIEREAFVDPGEVLSELDTYFREYPQGADVLTFSSGGEPTLYEPLGELVSCIKKRYGSLPLIVLTNGSLLWDPEVRRALMQVDRVVPSLDAVSPDVFKAVNRSHPMLDLAVIMEGIEAFRREYKGELHLEILLASAFNDSREELLKLRQAVDRIRPDRVELNTVVRPPAYEGVRGLSAEEMQAASAFFPPDRTLIVGRFQGVSPCTGNLNLPERIVEMVRRRPCTVPEMTASLGVSPEALNAALAGLFHEERVTRYLFGGKEYVKER